MGYGRLVTLFMLIWVQLNGVVDCQGNRVVNVGAVFTFNSVIGRVAKVAIEAAMADINADPCILKGVELRIIMEDSDCSVFMGSIKVFQVLQKEVVAIIGPQSSSIAHMISVIASGLQVPLLSFAATDPTLSALQFPYFIRTTSSDSYQMTAMADLINYYGWREIIAIFVDDDYGRNGMSYLDDELTKRMKEISYKLALPIHANLSQISDLLATSKLLGPRVYVIHVSSDSGLAIFSVAESLQMMTSDYVWLTTDWLSTTLDSSLPINRKSHHYLQGVVGLRQHIPRSSKIKHFVSRWRAINQRDLVHSRLNNYGFYAYDTVWMVARAINEFLKEDGNITFSLSKNLHEIKPSALRLEKLKTFDGGQGLLTKLLQTNFTGLTGQVQFDLERNLIVGAYDVINIVQGATRRIGFWSNQGLSILPPEMLNKQRKSVAYVDQKLGNATWPGGKTEKPRGWVIGTTERPLRIGVPNRASFVEFVTEVHSTHNITGYSIDVFNAARELIPYGVPYRFKTFGDGSSNPSYDELVRMVAEDAKIAKKITVKKDGKDRKVRACVIRTMADEEKLKIERLNRLNLGIWKMQVEDFLYAEDFDFLQGGISMKPFDMSVLEGELLDRDVLGVVRSTLATSISLQFPEVDTRVKMISLLSWEYKLVVSSNLKSRKWVTFNDVVEIFGENSRIIPFGTSLLTSNDYPNAKVRGRGVLHIENRNKRRMKA
ncbi:hypothetical protein GIB67_035903 [Kingdonia uniflora]|uniref:Receptor ligand binding region domain-containing protein n=1 Tax=Kingdonia uniflora TaxID=39325 RepID=A0A7J7P8N4_9MAGN|nr:hypothetical protein GIB67_035903 [Kingdonia uniflora]